MPQRRLLVITFHFPPDGSVGGWRWAGLSKYLARRGWEVHVVTACRQAAKAASPGVHVHYVRPGRTLNDVYNAWFVQRPAQGASGQTVVGTGGPQSATRERLGLIGRLRRNGADALALPDYGRGWVLRAAWVARRLLRDMQCDAVVSSGPPHSAHIAGVLACARSDRPLFVDMRDPWAALLEQSWAKRVYGSRTARFVIQRLERLAFRKARAIVTNTAAFADVLHEQHPRLQVWHIANGIDPERLPPRPLKKHDGFSVAYAGSLYAGRDLTTTVRALGVFLAVHPEARDAVRLRVAGPMEPEHERRFEEVVDEQRLRGTIEILGNISTDEALDLVNRSHLNLVLAQDQPMQVPAKLYESVGLGVETLVIAESSSASAREAARVGATSCDPHDVEGIRQVIERTWSRAVAETDVARNAAAIYYDDIAAQFETLLDSTGKHESSQSERLKAPWSELHRL